MADHEGLGDLPVFDYSQMSPRKIVDMEEVEETDYQYMTKMYPSVSREALEFVEELCDQMEYQGSMMFDEYVDRRGFLDLADQVYEKCKYHDKDKPEKKDSMLYQLILALVGGEICHRRCRYRRKRQMFS